MVELPNKDWIRSTKRPEYSICLDVDSSFFGWKLFENSFFKNWEPVKSLTQDEIIVMKEMPSFNQHINHLNKLL